MLGYYRLKLLLLKEVMGDDQGKLGRKGYKR
jgi:hypothetical protein